MIDPVSAVILAGGLSRRLGHDKRVIRIASSQTLLEQTVSRLTAVSDDVVVVGSKFVLDQSVLTARVVYDDGSGRGPLVGIVTGLRVATHNYNVVVACDMPFLNESVLRAMLALPRGYDLLVPRRADGTLEMLHAVYSRACLDVAESRLTAGRLNLRGLVPELLDAGRSVAYLDDDFFREIDPQLTTFFNVNTSDDLATARMIGGMGSQ